MTDRCVRNLCLILKLVNFAIAPKEPRGVNCEVAEQKVLSERLTVCYLKFPNPKTAFY